ncbi:MAG TPA: DUF3857 domain-containing protein, partial [Opitutales bacterium]|nr:DUF3857 domain-containing protein [Opitutales bacterium]
MNRAPSLLTAALGSLRIALICILVVGIPCVAHAGKTVKDLPEWLRTAMSRPVGDFAKDAAAVRIVNWTNTQYEVDGTESSEVRSATRILTMDGAEFAEASIIFNRKSDTIRDLKAWLVLPNGEVRQYSDKDFLSHEAGDYSTLFTERWRRSFSFRNAVKPGCVVAWTYKIRGRSQFGEDFFFVREKCPILESTVRIKVPAGWSVRSVPVNSPQVTEQFDGTTYTLVSTEQPGIKPEALTPRGTTFPRMDTCVVPSARDRERSRLFVYDDWNSLARFDVGMNDPQAVPDDAIRAKTAELVAGCDTLWKKISAICAYVQSVNYIAIGKNLAAGGGLKPNSAAAVFAHNYGDCKDKTALLRAMLSCIGVQSYATACLASYDSTVNPGFPSPCNFNHCIAA